MEQVEPVQIEFEDKSNSCMKPAISTGKWSRPDSMKEEFEFSKVKAVYEKLDKINRKMYALHNKRVGYKQALDQVPG